MGCENTEEFKKDEKKDKIEENNLTVVEKDVKINDAPENKNDIINYEKPSVIDVPLPKKMTYQMLLYTEAYGISISKNMLKQEFRKVNFEKNIKQNSTPKFTNKKRAPPKNETSLLKTCPTTEQSNFSTVKVKNHAEANKNVKTKKLLFN